MLYLIRFGRFFRIVRPIESLDVAKNHQIQNFGSKFEFSEAIFFQNGKQLLDFSN